MSCVEFFNEGGVSPQYFSGDNVGVFGTIRWIPYPPEMFEKLGMVFGGGIALASSLQELYDHMHSQKAEIYQVLSGKIIVPYRAGEVRGRIDSDEYRVLDSDQMAYIPQETIHGIRIDPNSDEGEARLGYGFPCPFGEVVYDSCGHATGTVSIRRHPSADQLPNGTQLLFRKGRLTAGFIRVAPGDTVTFMSSGQVMSVLGDNKVSVSARRDNNKGAKRIRHNITRGIHSAFAEGTEVTIRNTSNSPCRLSLMGRHFG